MQTVDIRTRIVHVIITVGRSFFVVAGTGCGVGLRIRSGHVIRQAGRDPPFGRQRSLLIAIVRWGHSTRPARLMLWPHHSEWFENNRLEHRAI